MRKQKCTPCMNLHDCIELAKRQRCLPNRAETGNPISLLHFLSVGQLSSALAQSSSSSSSNPLQILQKLQPKGSKQRELLSYLAGEPNVRELCQLALLEREASRLPDAFFTHCRDLSSCLASLTANESKSGNVAELIELRLSLGPPENWRSVLSELILAPKVKPETVAVILGICDRIVPQFTEGNSLASPESLLQLVASIESTAGPEKIQMATSAGMGASWAAVLGEVPSALDKFIQNSIRYNYSEDEDANYELLHALFYPESSAAQSDAWIAGTYLYLTGRISATHSATLPQLALHSLLSDTVSSLSRNLLCCTLASTFMQKFSGADFTPVLKRLSQLNDALDSASELLAVPHCSTTGALFQLFFFANAGHCDELWTYKKTSKPWSSAGGLTVTAGAFGMMHGDGAVARQLAFSDYSMHFEWGGIKPLQHTLDETMAESPILQRLVDESMTESILSDRLTTALEILTIENPAPAPSTSDPTTGFDTQLEGWDEELPF